MIENILFCLIGFDADNIVKQQVDNKTVLSLSIPAQEQLTRSERLAAHTLLQLGVEYKTLLTFSNDIRIKYSAGTEGTSHYLCTFGSSLRTVVLDPYVSVCDF